MCRTKAKFDQSEALKKAAAADARKKQKVKKKNGKKENAKKVAELMESLNINSPDTSSEDESSSESSGDEGSPGTSVKRVQETPQSRREARAQEFAETISDQKVIDTLNRTKMASKVKKAKTEKGMSYTEAEVSKNMDFRECRTEMLLLDSGAMVNIVGEDIVKDTNVKVYKLKEERVVTEASGNLLNIIGVCEIFIKLPFIRKTKKMECLVLRGSEVDRKILVS